MTTPALATAVLIVALSTAGCHDGGSGTGAQPTTTSTTTTTTIPAGATGTTATVEPGDVINPADFSATVDHPLVALAAYHLQVFEGTQQDNGKTIKTRTEKRVLEKPAVVARVPVTVLEVKEYEDGELVETTLDYFAQHRDGSVWYFGERIDDYEGGKVTGHGGQWQAGEGNAQPGIYMPAHPAVGQDFAQERAPGVAEDRSTVLLVDAEVTVPAGRFTGCIRVKDYSPIDKATEFKFYCPRLGIVREEEPHATSDLVSST